MTRLLRFLLRPLIEAEADLRRQVAMRHLLRP